MNLQRVFYRIGIKAGQFFENKSNLLKIAFRPLFSSHFYKLIRLIEKSFHERKVSLLLSHII